MKHPGRWLWMLLVVPILIGLARLHLDVDVFDLLPEDLPVVAGLKLYQEHFADARELIITLKASDPEQAENAARSIAETLRKDTNEVAVAFWQPPWLEHPEQTAELLGFLWLNQPSDRFAELSDRLRGSKLLETLAAAREELATSLSPAEIARLSYDPFGFTRLDAAAGPPPGFGQGQEMFGSADGTFRVIFLKASHDLRTYRDCDLWLSHIKQKVSQAMIESQASGKVVPGYTGRPAFVAEIAGGMQRDITYSVGGTAVIIAILFWLAHRRVKPMLWLLTLLALILVSTLGMGGLIFGKINVVSMGFAAILLGLAVDYAVVHYQEALAHPMLSIPQIRGAIAPSIFWAAVTTISAFLVLNFGGLPGLGQLGTLVGVGVALSACIMIFEFLPPLFPDRRSGAGPLAAEKVPTPGAPSRISVTRVLLVSTGTVVLVAFSIANFRSLPVMDATANALRPRNSPAYSTLDQLKIHLNDKREPLWVIVSGSEADVARKLENLQPLLEQAVSNGVLSSFTLPTTLWPRPQFHEKNLAIASQIVGEKEHLREAALSSGFTSNAWGLSERVLETWTAAAKTPGTYWPTNPLSQWIFEKVTSRTTTNDLALGLLNPNLENKGLRSAGFAEFAQQLDSRGILLSGWELLGQAIFSRVRLNMWRVLVPMCCLVFLSLLLSFRRPREVLLSLTVLVLSAGCLLTVMKWAGWSWNLLNLMALPLVLGTGVDYSIFMQLALRRHHGDLRMAYQAVGRALLLCGGTAIAGFGSLAWSSNAGMASLGQVCAVGIASNMIISVYLLPVWWALTARLGGSAAAGAPPSEPSSLYSAEVWRLGCGLVRMVPLKLCRALSRGLVEMYWHLAVHRRNVVIENLLPGAGNDRTAAKKTAKRLFQQFGIKVIDLWRYEAGLPIDDLLGDSTGWEHFQKAKEQNRGVLFLTPHLGNWEFGGPWLTRRGYPLQVITLAEPGEDFTRLRQASRARWKIETLVIGNDPFAFVEVIRRLEAGATVALLVDRPPPPTAVIVNLFGRTFSASVAAAELARASGCVLLPVYLPRGKDAYAAHVLPPIEYDRAALRDREARRKLTQEILRAFEPIIGQHLDQWYHFVPVWPKANE